MRLLYELFLNIQFIIIVNLLCKIELCFPQTFEQPTQISENELMPRVVSGFPAKFGDVPYQIGFKMLKKRSHSMYLTFCGGVIIGPSKLLSAAHCFAKNKRICSNNSIVLSGDELNEIYAVAGSLVNQEEFHKDNHLKSQWRRLNKAVYPCTYRFPRRDICIVITMKPFIFNSYVAPIPYASKYKNYKGECLASGYGRLSKPFASPKVDSEKLMLAKLAIIPAYWCSKRHHRSMKYYICTSDKVTDVGKGDSGGPLVCAKTRDPNDKGQGVVVGIVSGNKLGAGAFFTRVSSYYDFIEHNNANSLLMPSYSYLLTAIYCTFYLS